MHLETPDHKAAAPAWVRRIGLVCVVLAN